MISPVKELQSARKAPRDDRSDRSLPPSRNLEGFLGEVVPSGVMKAYGVWERRTAGQETVCGGAAD